MKKEPLKYENGQPFTAKIEGTFCKGRVRVTDERRYLCQHKMDGAKPTDGDTLGYPYSWGIYDGTDTDLFYASVTNLVLDPMTISSREKYLLRQIRYWRKKAGEKVVKKGGKKQCK